MKTLSKNNEINLFYVETPLHLFLSMIKTTKAGSKSYLIVDSHRKKQKKLVESLDSILDISFDKIIFSHDFNQISNIGFKNPITSVYYYVRIFRETSRIINEFKNDSSVIYLNVFSFNRIERILFNRLQKISTVNLNICDEGIGSYTSEFYLLGKDSCTKKNIFFESIIRKILLLKINIEDVKKIELIKPNLNAFNNPRFINKIFKFNYNPLKLNQILNDINKFNQFEFKISNTPKRIYLSSNLNNEFERNFFNTLLKKENFHYKNHPSIELNENSIDLDFLPWEIIQIKSEIEFLISYASSTGLSLLNMDFNITTKYLFVFEIFHSNNIVWFEYETEKQLFYNYQKYYPENVFIPKSINELILLIHNDKISNINLQI